MQGNFSPSPLRKIGRPIIQEQRRISKLIQSAAKANIRKNQRVGNIAMRIEVFDKLGIVKTKRRFTNAALTKFARDSCQRPIPDLAPVEIPTPAHRERNPQQMLFGRRR